MNTNLDASTASVAAVIVTFNRLEKLPRTIESVLSQTHECSWVLVINNGSSDGTFEYLNELNDPRIIVRHLQENRGGAGGFEYGMALGYELGADYVWIMDDDCYPEPPALERLLVSRLEVAESLGKPVPFACSVVKAIDGSLCEMNNPITTWDWPRAFLAGNNAMRVVECTFVSVLVPRYVLAEAGLPLSEYFIWFDDKEYTKRLSARYAPGIIVMDSVVVHDMGVNAGVNYRQVTENNLWKFASGARNQSSYRWHYEGAESYNSYKRRVLSQMREGKVPLPVQQKMAKAIRTGKTFHPTPRFPSDLKDEIVIELGQVATAPPATIIPLPAEPFASEASTARRRRKRRTGSIVSRIRSLRRRPITPSQLHQVQVRINLLKDEITEFDQQRLRVNQVIDRVEEQLTKSSESARP